MAVGLPLGDDVGGVRLGAALGDSTGDLLGVLDGSMVG